MLLLSPRGLHLVDPLADEYHLVICTGCHNSLKNPKVVHPPKFAIANGFWIGQLPSHLRPCTMSTPNRPDGTPGGATKLEVELVNPTYKSARMWVLTGRGDRTHLFGHVHTTELDVLKVASKILPKLAEEASTRAACSLARPSRSKSSERRKSPSFAVLF